jgi:hypothetical protein
MTAVTVYVVDSNDITKPPVSLGSPFFWQDVPRAGELIWARPTPQAADKTLYRVDRIEWFHDGGGFADMFVREVHRS